MNLSAHRLASERHIPVLTNVVPYTMILHACADPERCESCAPYRRLAKMCGVLAVAKNMRRKGYGLHTVVAALAKRRA